MTHVIGDAAFVGDTLFMPDGGSARADFPGGDARALYRSIRRVLELPGETRLFMCHDYGPNGRDINWETTVAEERAHNIHVQRRRQRGRVRRNARGARQDARHAALIIPSLQCNMRAGQLPPQDEDGKTFLKVPVNSALTGEASAKDDRMDFRKINDDYAVSRPDQRRTGGRHQGGGFQQRHLQPAGRRGSRPADRRRDQGGGGSSRHGVPPRPGRSAASRSPRTTPSACTRRWTNSKARCSPIAAPEPARPTSTARRKLSTIEALKYSQRSMNSEMTGKAVRMTVRTMSLMTNGVTPR